MMTSRRALAAAGGRRVAWLLLVLVLGGCATMSALQTVESLIRQGKELYASGRYDEALVKLQEAIRRDPKALEAYIVAARSYIAKRSWGDAIATARKAVELAPAEGVGVLAEGLRGGGLDALGRGQFSDAAGLLVEYVKLVPGNLSAYIDLGRAYLGTGAYADALRALREPLTRGTAADRQEVARLLLDGGRRALSSGNARDAAGLLAEYVRVDSGNASAYLDLGRAYWQAGARGDALAAFRRVLELSPGNAEALRFIGESLR